MSGDCLRVNEYVALFLHTLDKKTVPWNRKRKCAVSTSFHRSSPLDLHSGSSNSFTGNHFAVTSQSPRRLYDAMLGLCGGDEGGAEAQGHEQEYLFHRDVRVLQDGWW